MLNRKTRPFSANFQGLNVDARSLVVKTNGNMVGDTLGALKPHRLPISHPPIDTTGNERWSRSPDSPASRCSSSDRGRVDRLSSAFGFSRPRAAADGIRGETPASFYRRQPQADGRVRSTVARRVRRLAGFSNPNRFQVILKRLELIASIAA